MLSQRVDSRLDVRLDRIEALLEEGNQHAKDSRLEIQEDIGHLHDKVDQVNDTVTYIKKNMSTITPKRLAILLLILLAAWIATVHYFIRNK